MVIIRTSATEVSIQAVSPELGVQALVTVLEQAGGEAGAGAAAGAGAPGPAAGAGPEADGGLSAGAGVACATTKGACNADDCNDAWAAGAASIVSTVRAALGPPANSSAANASAGPKPVTKRVRFMFRDSDWKEWPRGLRERRGRARRCGCARPARRR